MRSPDFMKNKINEFRQIAGYFAADLALPMDFIAEFLGVEETQLTEAMVKQGLVLALPVGTILAVPPEALPPAQPDQAQAISTAVIDRLTHALRRHNKVQQLAAFQSLGAHMVTLTEKLEPFGFDNHWKLYALMAQYLMLVGKTAEANDFFHQALHHFPENDRGTSQEFNQLRLQTADAETALGNTKAAAKRVQQVMADEAVANGQPNPLLLVNFSVPFLISIFGAMVCTS